VDNRISWWNSHSQPASHDIAWATKKGTKKGAGTAGLTWKEAEEAADGLFSNGRTELGFDDFANHFQDILAMSYAKVCALRGRLGQMHGDV
jgi:hypothetical protein